MKMITGGAFQGKRAYARQTYGIADGAWTDGETCDPAEALSAPFICNFHALVRRAMEEELDLSAWAEDIARENPSLILTADEIGCGIVPVKPEERVWREACGRTLTRLASDAEEVVRVFCGIGVRIK